jgi:Asp/Glu/hydantoin racemase
VLVTEAEIEESASQCLKPLLQIASEYDGFLMACFTNHPLRQMLQAKVGRKPVVGMFEATLTTAMHLVTPGSKFAIVTTASSYVDHLTDGVRSFLGIADEVSLASSFAGVVASGITWEVLTKQPRMVAKEKMIHTVSALVKGGDVSVVCLGGAILVGLANWAEEACIMELGETTGRNVRILDQIHSGIVTLDELIRIESCSNS